MSYALCTARPWIVPILRSTKNLTKTPLAARYATPNGQILQKKSHTTSSAEASTQKDGTETPNRASSTPRSSRKVRSTKTPACHNERAGDRLSRLYQNKVPELILLDLSNAARSKGNHFEKPYDLARHFISRVGPNFDTETFHKITTYLIHANASPEGSVSRVLKHLSELEEEGLSPKVDECLAMLEVLSVHTDFLVRLQILRYMEESWFGLTDEAQHYVVAGYFRELQLEKAMEQLQRMNARERAVQVWLFDLAAAVLAGVGELNEVLEVLRMKGDRFEPIILPAFGVWLLNQAVEFRHIGLAKYLCQQYLKDRNFRPSAGLLTAVLELAADHGDVEFANQVLKDLIANNITLTPAQCEALLKTTAYAGFVEQAFNLLWELHTLGMPVQPSHTHWLRQAWIRSKKPTSAYEFFTTVVQPFHDVEHHRVPVALINLLLELCALEGESLSRVLEIFEWGELNSFEEIHDSAFYRLWKTVQGDRDAEASLKGIFEDKKDERALRMLNLAAESDVDALLLGVTEE